MAELNATQAAAKRLLENQLAANATRYHKTTDEHLDLLRERLELEELWRLNPAFGDVPVFRPTERLVRTA